MIFITLQEIISSFSSNSYVDCWPGVLEYLSACFLYDRSLRHTNLKQSSLTSSTCLLYHITKRWCFSTAMHTPVPMACWCQTPNSPHHLVSVQQSVRRTKLDSLKPSWAFCYHRTVKPITELERVKFKLFWYAAARIKVIFHPSDSVMSLLGIKW